VTFHNTDSGTPTSTAAADFATHQGIFGGYVINVTWGQLQPTSTTVVTHPNVIDDALTQLRAYNAANPTAPLVGKLRVWQGANAPGWAKALNGGPLSIVRNSTGGTITVGLYWSAPYIAAWRTLQQQLAALYDSEPLIAGVHMTSCSAQGDEPLVATSDAASSTTLYNAGLTDASFQACLNGFPQDYSAWKQTPIVFTFNPYQDRDGPQQIPPTGNVLEPWVTFRLMETCRTVLGNRCYLENHELNCPGSTSVAFIYDELRALGPPINLQTMSPAQLPTDWTSVLNSGINTGASGVELWLNYGGFATMQNTTLQGYANLFAGSGVACP